ncbi:alpha/beta hydrolase [Sungkyunkwania multivorans]|uniref:Alpha/beta hydrolase n=1 Tax=Sungkyunkwania multivorans TaxID=1173618 RepID=A0ABW3CXT9_9FLAO
MNSFKYRFLVERCFMIIPFCFLLWINTYGQDADYILRSNIPYYADSIIKTDSYLQEKCLLDIYYPTKIKNFPTVVWFHGGGLAGGEKFIPERLKNQGVGVVAVNYRLYPKVKNPAYLADAAAAVAWVFKHIESYGGTAQQIFISGHSAGGYLASMLGIDKKWLKEQHIDADDIAGVIPMSGHTITHFTIRKERGISGERPVVDEFAPLFHVRKEASPFLLITGDRNLEMLGRYEENAYFFRMMKVVGHKDVTLYELKGYGHQMTEPAFPLLLKFIREKSKR